MTELERESEILRRAVSAGYLRKDDVAAVERAPPPRRPSSLGPRIELLLSTGNLTPSQLQLLIEADPGGAFEKTLPPLSSSKSAAALAQGDTLDGHSSEAQAMLAAAFASQFPVENWDRYEFIKLLGQGGMGAVYKARDRRLNRIVALKFIRGGDEQMTRRFMQEARAQSRVDHAGIYSVHGSKKLVVRSQ